ncbi:MAG: cytidine deaminase, partial [Bacteroidales bacterium]|nr:cytidine deaminase [Bacteroidales bacterium]
MENKTLSINYTVYGSVDEMLPQDRELVMAAIEAQKSSYAPYSKFNVGAAVRLDDGTIVKGSNQENAASPSGLCAERTAMFAAGAQYPGIPMV